MKNILNIVSICSISLLLSSQAGCTENDNDSEQSKTNNETACYSITEGKDVTAIQLTKDGDKISGYYSWRPYEKDGAYGMLEGTETDGKIIADYTYIIEGSTQSDEVIFKRDGNNLIQGFAELEEKGEKLVIKDVNTVEWKEHFKNTACDTLKDPLDAAKITSEEILKNK